jgi:hypothetical protein
MTQRLMPFVILGMMTVPCWAASTADTAPASQTDAQAEARLSAMANKLAAAKHFSVAMHMDYDVLQSSGQKIQFSEQRKVHLRRPDKLRVDSIQSDGDTAGMIFDGKLLTLFHKNENVYSQTSKQGSVDDILPYMIRELGIRVPLARMLVTTLPEEFKKLNTSVQYVERNTLDKTPTDHIAARTQSIDYQIWIADDELPRRIVITYINDPGKPQFQASFSDWNLSPATSAADFSYTPPKGAEKIRTLVPAQSTVKAVKAKE